MSADTSQQLRGRTVVVTGASSGIGAAAARHFVERGATVAVVGRSPRNTAVIGGRRARSRRGGGPLADGRDRLGGGCTSVGGGVGAHNPGRDAVNRGGMSGQLATPVRSGSAAPTGTVTPVVPVFVDATGRRRTLMTGLGWLVALSCVVYLGVIGVSMTGTSVGSLPEVPSVAPQLVVFGSQAAALPPGALESTLPAPAMTPRATPPQTQAPATSRARIKGTSR